MTTTLLHTKIAEGTGRARSARAVARRSWDARTFSRAAGEIDSGDVLGEKQQERWTDLELEQVSGETPLR